MRMANLSNHKGHKGRQDSINASPQDLRLLYHKKQLHTFFTPLWYPVPNNSETRSIDGGGKMSKWAVLAGAITAAVVLLLGLGYGVSQIAAQEPAVTPAATPRPVPPQGPGAGGYNCPCGVSQGEAACWGWRAYGQADIVAQALGVSVDDLTAALRDGRSVADLAAEKGVALDTVVEALLAPRREALAQAVIDGWITQQRADTMLANMQENITEQLQETGPLGGMGLGPAGQVLRAERLGWRMHGQADLVAQALGMSVDDLTAALRDGRSVADLAAEKGVALDTVVEALLAPRREALAQRVAAGNLTQAEADARLAQMEESITNRLQQPWKPGGMLGRGGMGGRMGGGGMWRTTQP
jgi:lambda repressor-like predicted transcriptional regulator